MTIYLHFNELNFQNMLYGDLNETKFHRKFRVETKI